MRHKISKIFRKYAYDLGYRLYLNNNQYVIFLEKDCKNTGWIKIGIYYSPKRLGMYTVSTYIDHPKMGPGQLYRRELRESEVKQILKNPRVHTGKGYYER